jgi:hypothetical protein
MFPCNRNSITTLAYLFPFLVCVTIYLPGLKGGFLFDDYANIIANPSLYIDTLSFNSLREAAFSSYSGKFQRPVSMVSFALNHWAFNSLDVYGFKAFNLILHILNGALLFVFLKLLANNSIVEQPNNFKKDWFIISVVFAWLISPLNVSTVLYVVQRMAMLSAFFVLCGLISYIFFREHLNRKQNGKSLLYLFLFSGCVLLATLSKENGILLPYFALLLELVFFRFATNSKGAKVCLLTYSSSLILLLLVILLWLLFVNPEYILSGYEARSFTLYERILTESRVLWWYIQNLIFPINTGLGLFHDDYALSTSLFKPVNTVFAIVGLIAIVLTSLLTFKKSPFLNFGLLFFFIGHSLESTVFPLEIIFEHRNYLPGIGIYIAFFFAFWKFIESSKHLAIARVLLFVFILFFTVSTVVRTNTWSNNLSLATTQALNHPKSARAHTMLGTELLKFANYATDALEKDRLESLALNELTQAIQLNPQQTTAHFKIISILYKKHREINEERISLLEDQLATGKFDASAINHINNLVNQAISKADDALPTKTIMRVLNAATKNINIGGRNRAELYTLISKFLLRAAHDEEYALYFIEQAAQLVPSNPTYRVHLAIALNELGKPEEACDELKTAAKIDQFGQETGRINNMQKIIGICN